MDIGRQRRGEIPRIDGRPPPPRRRQPGVEHKAVRLLRRDDIGDVGAQLVEVGEQGAARRIDGHHPAVGPVIDNAVIQALPRGREQLALGDDPGVGVERHELRARLAAPEIVRDQADAFVGARRAAIGSEGDRHRDHAAVRHGGEAVAQQNRFGAGLPRRRKGAVRRRLQAVNIAAAQRNARRQHEAVVTQEAVRDAHGPRRGIDPRGAIAQDANAMPARQRVVADGDVGHGLESDDRPIADRARAKRGFGFDQHHFDRRVLAADLFRRGAPAPPAADHDRAPAVRGRGLALRQGEKGQRRAGREARSDQPPARPAHGDRSSASRRPA